MDTKSAGILGACLVVAALVLALVPRPQPAAPAPSGPQVGRYQMSGVPGHASGSKTTTRTVFGIAPAFTSCTNAT